MEEGIPLQKHGLGVAEVRAVQKVLGSPRLTRGSATRLLEDAFAEYVGAAHAVAFCSGTAGAFALFQAIADRGLPLHMTPINFVGVANAAILAGAGELRFHDIDPSTGHVEFPPDVLPERRVYQHHGGLAQTLPADYTSYAYEDASHALGVEGVGSCARSHATFFSLHASKLLVAGEGGMVTTNDRDLDSMLRLYRNAGRTADGRPIGLGLNLHMTELQAALAYPQLATLRRQVFRRRQLVNRYRDMLRGCPGVALLSYELEHAHHLFQVRVPGRLREGLRQHLRAMRIETAVHFPALPTLSCLRRVASIVEQSPITNARAWGEQALSLPLFSTMTDPQVAVVAYEVRRFMEAQNSDG